MMKGVIAVVLLVFVLRKETVFIYLKDKHK